MRPRARVPEGMQSRNCPRFNATPFIIPIGTQKCKVKKKDGKEVEAPYVYAVSIKSTSDDKKFLQLAPPINARCRLKIQNDYNMIESPVAHKTDKEIVEMIAKSMHNDLWNHRPQNKVEKSQIEQAWVDDYTLLIILYIRADKFDDDEEVVGNFAYILAGRLQKVRANRELDIKGETPKQHLGRTMDIVNE